MNDYERLEALGWKRTGGNSRWDFYHKKNWICIVPSTIDWPMKFHRITKEQ